MRTLTLVIILIAAPVYADDWPQWLGPKRDGVWRETGIIDKFPKDGPKIVWRQPVGPGYSGPAVVGDRVYLMDRPSAAGTAIKDAMARTAMAGNERVLCLDAATGKEVWKCEYDCPYRKLSYPSGPRCTPLVHGGKVYTLGAMGHLFCFDANNGKILWSKELSKEYKTEHPIWGHSAHPLIDGDKLITLVGGKGSAVVALNKDTGAEIWKSLTADEVCYVPPTIFDAGGKRQLIIWLAETLNALNPETGESYWMAPYPENGEPQRPATNIAQPLKIGDTLFVSSFYHGALAMTLAKDKPEAKVLYRGKDKDPDEGQGPELADGYADGSRRLHLRRGCQRRCALCGGAGTGEPVWQSKKPFSDKDAIFGTIFFIPNGERDFLYTDQGDLIIAKLTPKGMRNSPAATC